LLPSCKDGCVGREDWFAAVDRLMERQRLLNGGVVCVASGVPVVVVGFITAAGGL